MKFNLKLLGTSFRLAIEEKLGPLEVNEENPLDDQFIDCSERRFSDALFVVKRYHYETGVCKAHVMDTDEFDVRWDVFFADFQNYPHRHEKAPRQQIKYANQLLVQSMYGSEVANGMKANEFDPSMAVCLMNSIADASDSIRWDRKLLTDILDRGLEIYPALEMEAKILEMEAKMAAELESKGSIQKMKI